MLKKALLQAVAHLPVDQGLSLKLDQMDISLVEGEDAVEWGKILPEDEPEDLAAIPRPLRQLADSRFQY
jgi:hypothetical protein